MSLVLIVRIFQLQILNGKSYTENFTYRTTANRTLKSTRGNIYDYNGKLIAYNELASTITIEDNENYETTREKNLKLNAEIYRLCQLIKNNGDSLSQDFHIVLDEDGNFAFDTENETTLARFRADIYGYPTVDQLSDQEAAASPDQIMELLCGSERYGLYITDLKDSKAYTTSELSSVGLPESFTNQEKLDIVIVRYNLSLVSFQRYMSVTVALNVSEKTVAEVKENSETLPGVAVSEDYIRVYNNSVALAPVIGYTGRASADELEELQAVDKKYNNNSIIGKSGIEQYMETTLSGTDGSEEVTIDNLGKVVAENEESRVDPMQGNDIYLTIDSDLQDACYKILEQRIAGVIVNYLKDDKSFDATKVEDSINNEIASYDCYYALINNNIIKIDRFTEEDASADEKLLYSQLTAKQESIIQWLKDELNSGTRPYAVYDAEKAAIADYVIETYLMNKCGILADSNMNTEDPVYQQYFTDGALSMRDMLLYGANNNWIDVSKLDVENESYLTTEEIFQAIIRYLENNLREQTAFNKLLYKYLLQDDSITPKNVLQILYDQGVLDTKDSDYAAFSKGSLTPYGLLVNKITNLEITPAMLALDPCAGSIVITDTATGEVRACVSYPGYDNNKLTNNMDYDYFASLNVDLSTPFYNKATQQLSAPGSTYKPIMAAAGLDTKLIDSGDNIECTGAFGDKLDFLSESDRVHCWNTWGHGDLNVSQALENSCNVFFCQIGYLLGVTESGRYQQSQALEKEAEYTAMFGLNRVSGIELTESEPKVTDSLPIPSAIGQGTHQYTTTQLNRYALTIGNQGNVYNLTLVSKITDASGNVLSEHAVEPVETAEFNSKVWTNIWSGMEAAITSDITWADFPKDEVTVYGKTGTAQENLIRPDHGLIIGFTKKLDSNIKYSDISYAVRICNGYSSKNASLIAKDALMYYFALQDESDIITGQADDSGMSSIISRED